MAYSLKYVSKLQKRTRDKEYRLRTKGADQANVEAASPRVDWSHVKRMSARERDNYARRLMSFNKRDNRLVPLASGEIIPYTLVQRMETARKKINKKARIQRAKINAIKSSFRDLPEKTISQPSVGGLTEIGKMLLPKTKRGAVERVKKMEAAGKRTRNMRRSLERTNMAKMLRAMNREDLALAIERMGSKAFDAMSARSDIWNVAMMLYETGQKYSSDRIRAYEEDTPFSNLEETISTGYRDSYRSAEDLSTPEILNIVGADAGDLKDMGASVKQGGLRGNKGYLAKAALASARRRGEFGK